MDVGAIAKSRSHPPTHQQCSDLQEMKLLKWYFENLCYLGKPGNWQIPFSEMFVIAKILFIQFFRF